MKKMSRSAIGSVDELTSRSKAVVPLHRAFTKMGEKIGLRRLLAKRRLRRTMFRQPSAQTLVQSFDVKATGLNESVVAALENDCCWTTGELSTVADGRGGKGVAGMEPDIRRRVE